MNLNILSYLQIACEQLASSRKPEVREGCKFRFGCTHHVGSFLGLVSPEPSGAAAPFPRPPRSTSPFGNRPPASPRAQPLPRACQYAAEQVPRACETQVGRGLAELQGWPLPCSTLVASLPTLASLCGTERLQARTGMDEEPRCTRGRNAHSPAALPRPTRLMKVWLLNGKTKFIFKQRIKGGRKRLLREACLLVPGGPQAELQNLLGFIICCNEAASGNKPPVATADGAGGMEHRDYSLSIESYPPPG